MHQKSRRSPAREVSIFVCSSLTSLVLGTELRHFGASERRFDEPGKFDGSLTEASQLCPLPLALGSAASPSSRPSTLATSTAGLSGCLFDMCTSQPPRLNGALPRGSHRLEQQPPASL
ncbi:hypothetical protein GY45DRAFT_1315425 [Cubamyces sp. BRFM 1775]|nr:hypothetical protein GY45DRAFT_1315425 [Cubamyces sp. BRFM 1775]